MMRRISRWSAVVAAATLMVLTTGAPGEAPAWAQELSAAQAELVDRLLADGLPREEMVGLYESLAPSLFQPPACVSGGEMFTDVPASSPFCPWIEELARRGITGGCSADEYCPNDPVTRAQMAVFVIKATADEGFHFVGEPGEPVFRDGGQGDCVWGNLSPTLLDAYPASFYKDSDGIVHLAGFVVATPGVGGDGTCDIANDPSDAIIFRLPAGYRPEHVAVFPSPSADIGAQAVVPAGGVVIDGDFIPGGSVFVDVIADGLGTTLDGITFRAADPQTAPPLSGEPPSVSLEALRGVLGRGSRSGTADGKQ